MTDEERERKRRARIIRKARKTCERLAAMPKIERDPDAPDVLEMRLAGMPKPEPDPPPAPKLDTPPAIDRAVFEAWFRERWDAERAAEREFIFEWAETLVVTILDQADKAWQVKMLQLQAKLDELRAKDGSDRARVVDLPALPLRGGVN